jgi:glycosyltransferase involved in cell wall biosynthesis
MEKGIVFPLVSVIIPAYNVEKYFADTIQSVIDQTYPNLEILVVNDASTDGTPKILERIGSNHPQLKIIHQKENMGAAAARNKGYLSAKGNFIKFLDADDLINPEMIEQQMKLVESEDCIISAKWGRFINSLTTFKLSPEDCWQTLISTEWVCSSWKNAQSMTTPGIFLIPKNIIEKAGLWNTELSLFDDTEYFTRTILAAKKVIFSADSTLYYRSGHQSLSNRLDKAHAWSAYQSILKSTQYLISAENTQRTRLLCANSLQQLMYYLYPKYVELCNLLEKEIEALGGSSIEWPSSAKGKFLSRFIGWKSAKKITEWLR